MSRLQVVLSQPIHSIDARAGEVGKPVRSGAAGKKAAAGG